MTKAVGEPSGENAAESGRLAPESLPDSPVKARDGLTPTDVFAAAQARDARQRQGAEALIAGFDRPGRSPRRARPSGDFVDYYASSRNSKPFVPQRNTEDELNSAVERVEGLAPRKGLPSWARLVLVTVTACVVVSGLAYIATSEDPPAHVVPGATSLPSAAVSVRPPDDIPPPAAPNTVILPAPVVPDPNAPTLRHATPSAPAERARAPEPTTPPVSEPAQGRPSTTTTQPPPATAAPSSQTPPRDDFIRAL